MATKKQQTGSGANLRAVDKAAASEAGRALGSISTPKKAAAAAANSLKRKRFGRQAKDALTVPCTCGAGDAETVTFEGQAHKTTSCPRGRLLWQRARTERLRREREAEGEA